MSNVLALRARAEDPLPSLTPSEQRTYERACRLWRSAAMHVRGEAPIRPTLGATVSRVGGWFRWAS
jgi:hypothetical protein